MKTKTTSQYKVIQPLLTMLASSVLMALYTPAYALQALDDHDLSQVNAQDGLVIDLQYDRIDLDRVYLEDKTGLPNNTEGTLRAYINDITVTGSDLGTTYTVDVGSNGTNKAGIDLDINSRYGTIAAESFNICDGNGANCGSSLGGLTIQSTENAILKFKTENGLFNQNSIAEMTLGLKNLNIYITQVDAAVNNQLILKDFNFNFFGRGAIWIDTADGLQLIASGAGNYVDLTRVEDPAHTGKEKPGLNIELMYKGDVASGVFDTAGAQGIIRLGASGRTLESSLVFRGTDARDAMENILGFSYSSGDMAGFGRDATVLGSTGLALRMRAEFTRDDAAATAGGLPAGGKGVTLELAHAGDNAYGIEFSELTPLLVRKTAGDAPLNTDHSYLDTGNVYLNLASTKRLQMPTNDILIAAPFGAETLTSAADYSHLVHELPDNPNSIVAAIRGMDFQAVSRRSRFIASNDITNPADLPDVALQTWGLGLPIYNLNGNVAIYGTTLGSAERLGFGLGLSTQGVNAEGDKTTSILLIDGAPNPNDGGNPISYYVGARNIDMLITAHGSIGLESGKININMPKLLIAASLEVAAGYLPGAKYATGSNYAPLNNFLLNDDVLFGLKLRLDATDVDLSIVPGDNTLSGNNLGFEGELLLNSGALQISDPSDDSIFALDNLSGRIAFENLIKVNRNSVDFGLSFNFNPTQSPADVFRVRDINFYPAGGSAQRLGEMVITGGTLSSTMNIMPR
ncbi:MAG: DUF6160 family protein [Pseudomonadota bacterium]|nr:DUF6160 family protein [Pseudomonadota bacterium]